MPLLKQETFLSPPALLDQPFESGRWWLLHSRPRGEKALARALLIRQRAFFLPVYQHRWTCQGRTRNSYLPLFPGYLFLFGDSASRVAALETRLVVTAHPVGDQQQLHADLIRVNRLIASAAPLIPEDRLHPGALVEVIHGPFEGMRGKLIRRGSLTRFLVEITLLQRGVSVEVDGSMLRAVDQQWAG
jgi:transcriptional antiterminator RfaH